MPKMKLAPVAAIFTLRVRLLGISPAIWRELLVRGDTTLAKLHWVLQAAFGWENCHAHGFKLGKRWFGEPDPEDGLEVTDESAVTIAEVAPRAGKKLIYVDDFGDSWGHESEVVTIDAPVDGARYPACEDGARACPPGDSGGPSGCAWKLEARADPTNAEHDELVRRQTRSDSDKNNSEFNNLCRHGLRLNPGHVR